MYNTGQSCCSVERIYVHESLHDAFVEHFVDTVKGMRIGDPMDEATYIGAITRAPQLALLESPGGRRAGQGRARCTPAATRCPGRATGSSPPCSAASITAWS